MYGIRLQRRGGCVTALERRAVLKMEPMTRLVLPFIHDPFANTLDVEFLFWSPSHIAAVQTIRRSVNVHCGGVAILGEAGVGKTLVLQAYMANVNPQRVTVLYISYPLPSFPDLLKTIMRALHLPEEETPHPVDIAYRFLHTLLAVQKRGQVIVLLLDEAHKMPVDTLLTLLMFAAYTPGQPLQVVFAGLPEFTQLFTLPALRAFARYIASAAIIQPLSRRESLAYIRHRLTQVGAPEAQCFTPQALQRLVRQARGIPRVLNTLCTNALLQGVMRQALPVSATLVREVLAAYDPSQAR